jgi:hypothetical protein
LLAPSAAKGFDTDIHGLAEETVDGKRGYYVDCVRKNGSAKHL